MAALLSGLAVASVPEAGAQPYPPGPCTVTVSAQDLGAYNIGDVFTARLTATCAFDAGAAVSISVNGQDIGTKAADAGGGVTVTVRVVSATQLEINPFVAGRCGTNNIVLTGPSSAARATVTHTGSFTVLCPGVTPPKAVRGRVAFTGDNILRWGAVAAALVAFGGVLTVGARRRRARSGA
ncbi:MAG TPA: hypothetical protein VG455_14375 [Acidimicrobiales bacterium]|nr:hypothetical protein [Acidimicrobiales bacterium]